MRRFIISVALAVIAVVAVGGAVLAGTGGGSSVTRARLERSLPVTFANLYSRQARMLGHRGITPASLHAKAMCDKGGAVEKDLGPVALPKVPTNPAPFTIVEYFPDPDVSGFYDPRHHAVSLAYVVPVEGDCMPTQEALDLAWFTPEEAVSDAVRRQMTGGHDRLLRLALAHVGELP